MNKRIAVVVTNLAGSGGEKIALAQAKLFHKKSNKVVLFLLEDIKSYYTENLGFPVIPLTNEKNKFKLFGKFGYKLYAKILESKMKLFGDFDLVISNLPRSDRTVKELKHNNKYFVIHTSYKAEIEAFSKKLANKKTKLYKYLYNNENLITITNEMKDDFISLDIKPKTIQTIYNPFDFIDIIKKGEEDIHYQFDYIISPSAFRKEKRYDILLDSFNLLKNKNIKLLILAEYNQELSQMIKNRKLEKRVIITGFKKNPYKYINNAKLLVLSSSREGLPTVVIESLILNTLVVSTDCPTGPKEILTENLSKWLVPIGDSEKLALKIDEALNEKVEIKKELINKFNEDYIYKSLINLIKE